MHRYGYGYGYEYGNEVQDRYTTPMTTIDRESVGDDDDDDDGDGHSQFLCLRQVSIWISAFYASRDLVESVSARERDQRVPKIQSLFGCAAQSRCGCRMQFYYIFYYYFFIFS